MSNLSKVILLTFLLSIFLVTLYIGNSFYTLRTESQGLPCDSLPSYKDAKSIFYSHNETKIVLENFSSSLWLSLDSSRCVGKAEVVIFYGGSAEKEFITSIIGSTYHSIPYRLINI